MDISFGATALLFSLLTGSAMLKIRSATAPGRSRPHARGGTATAATSPCRSRAPRHTVRRLPACTPSRSDKSGKPRAAAGRVQIYIRVERPLRSIAAEKEAVHFAPQLRHGRIQRFRPWIDDDGPLRIQPIERVADSFPHPALDPIPDHRVAERTRNRKPDAGSGCVRVAKAKSGKARTRKAATLVVNPSEILRAQETNTFRKTSDGLMPFGADRELLAPTRPAPRENRTAILSLHAGAETVRFDAPAIIRLKRTFRHSDSSLSIEHAGGRSKSRDVKRP